jgi:hypothetical protein
MFPRRSIAVLGWLAAVVVATLAGLGAIRLVGDDLTGTNAGVRSQAEVARELAAATGAPTTRPTATGPTPTPADDARRGTFAVRGGSAVARCAGDLVTLESWSPAQDYRVVDVDQGPDDDAEVKFQGPGGHFEIKVECHGGRPVQVGDDD